MDAIKTADELHDMAMRFLREEGFQSATQALKALELSFAIRREHGKPQQQEIEFFMDIDEGIKTNSHVDIP